MKTEHGGPAAQSEEKQKSAAKPKDKRAEEAALHTNHRKRMRNRFYENGLNGMEDHQVLELLLFYAIPRYDTNGLAHRLLNTFGSFSGVFDASVDMLMQVPGIGRESAILIKLIPAVWGRYNVSENEHVQSITNREEMKLAMKPLFTNNRQEELICVFTDINGKILKKTVYQGGSHSNVSTNENNILRTAIELDASCVALAHSHPRGYSAPSYEDIKNTIRFAEQLKALHIHLIDHMIVSRDGEYFLSSNSNIPQDLFLFSSSD